MRPNAVEEIEVSGLKISIIHDDDNSGPRDWDNIGTMACFHSSYSIGDEKSKHGFSSIGELLRHCVKSGAVFLPIYLRDWSHYQQIHTDLSDMVKLKLNAACLDSGAEDHEYEYLCEALKENMIGIIFCDAEKIVKEYGDDSGESRLKALECMKGEIETYNQWLSGDVYGYVIERENTCDKCATCKPETLDSLWGMYGLDYALQEAKSQARAILQEQGAEIPEELQPELTNP